MFYSPDIIKRSSGYPTQCPAPDLDTAPMGSWVWLPDYPVRATLYPLTCSGF